MACGAFEEVIEINCLFCKKKLNNEVEDPERLYNETEIFCSDCLADLKNVKLPAKDLPVQLDLLEVEQ